MFLLQRTKRTPVSEYNYSNLHHLHHCYYQYFELRSLSNILVVNLSVQKQPQPKTEQQLIKEKLKRAKKAAAFVCLLCQRDRKKNFHSSVLTKKPLELSHWSSSSSSFKSFLSSLSHPLCSSSSSSFYQNALFKRQQSRTQSSSRQRPKIPARSNRATTIRNHYSSIVASNNNNNNNNNNNTKLKDKRTSPLISSLLLTFLTICQLINCAPIQNSYISRAPNSQTSSYSSTTIIPPPSSSSETLLTLNSTTKTSSSTTTTTTTTPTSNLGTPIFPASLTQSGKLAIRLGPSSPGSSSSSFNDANTLITTYYQTTQSTTTTTTTNHWPTISTLVTSPSPLPTIGPFASIGEHANDEPTTSTPSSTPQTILQPNRCNPLGKQLTYNPLERGDSDPVYAATLEYRCYVSLFYIGLFQNAPSFAPLAGYIPPKNIRYQDDRGESIATSYFTDNLPHNESTWMPPGTDGNDPSKHTTAAATHTNGSLGPAAAATETAAEASAAAEVNNLTPIVFSQLNQGRPFWGDEFIKFQNLYWPIHCVICLVITTIGIFANVTNIIVLTRANMITAVNTILCAIAFFDLIVNISTIPYLMHSLSDPTDQTSFFSYQWGIYTLIHAHTSVTAHTISIWLTCVLATWRYCVVCRTNAPSNQRTWSVSWANQAILGVFLIVPIFCIPNYLSFTIVPDNPPGVNGTIYITKLSAMAKESKFITTFHFWIFSCVTKLVPCILLTFFTTALIRTLLHTRERRLRLVSHGNCGALKGPQAGVAGNKTDLITMSNGGREPPSGLLKQQQQPAQLSLEGKKSNQKESECLMLKQEQGQQEEETKKRITTTTTNNSIGGANANQPPHHCAEDGLGGGDTSNFKTASSIKSGNERQVRGGSNNLYSMVIDSAAEKRAANKVAQARKVSKGGWSGSDNNSKGPIGGQQSGSDCQTEAEILGVSCNSSTSEGNEIFVQQQPRILGQLIVQSTTNSTNNTTTVSTTMAPTKMLASSNQSSSSINNQLHHIHVQQPNNNQQHQHNPHQVDPYNRPLSAMESCSQPNTTLSQLSEAQRTESSRLDNLSDTNNRLPSDCQPLVQAIAPSDSSLAQTPAIPNNVNMNNRRSLGTNILGVGTASSASNLTGGMDRFNDKRSSETTIYGTRARSSAASFGMTDNNNHYTHQNSNNHHHHHNHNDSNNSGNTLFGNQLIKLHATQRQLSQNETTTRLLIAVMIVFLICESPAGILAALCAIFGESFFENVYQPLGNVTDLLSLINSSVNFILYCFMSTQFRVTFYQVVLRCPAPKLSNQAQAMAMAQRN